MPSKSKAQQKFMGMVYSLKKGDIKPSDVSKDVKDAAKSMSKKDAKDYASTKHKGLPNRVKQEILNRLKTEYAFYHTQTRARKRDHDDDNNLGKNKKYSGQPDIEENKFAKKPEVTPKQLLKIQNDVRKINRKIRVYISKHPVTKGRLSIELGHGHDNDAEIHKIYNVLKKHTGSWKTGTMFNESGQKLSMNEIGIFPIKKYIKGMIPKGMWDTTTTQKKERLRAVVKDLVNTLNHYWKSNNIPFRVRDYRKSDYGKGITR